LQKLYKFQWDCGRMGSVEGLFVADEGEVAAAVGKEVYFGEILGKHSDVSGTLDAEDLTVATDDQDFIVKLVGIIGTTTISGYNPLSYIDGDED